MKIRIIRKTFTKFDETDHLKQMKDSDILAEQKKKAPGYGNVISSGVGGIAAGAAIGGVGGAIAGGVRAGGVKGFRGKAASVMKGVKGWGKTGAIVGGLVAGGMALHQRNKQANDIQFYNDRLEYAQRHARRRERKDWKQNMTQRDGYTY